MDHLLPDSQRGMLQAAPLTSARVFGDLAASAAQDLEQPREAAKLTLAIKELSEVAQQLVQHKPH